MKRVGQTQDRHSQEELRKRVEVLHRIDDLKGLVKTSSMNVRKGETSQAKEDLEALRRGTKQVLRDVEELIDDGE